MIHIFINLDKWNALPKNYQSILSNASAYANEWMMAKYDELNPAALKRLVAGGTQLQAVLARDHGSLLQGVQRDCTRKSRQTNASFKKVYDSMNAFLNDRYSWLQVAELNYDSFMIRHKNA